MSVSSVLFFLRCWACDGEIAGGVLRKAQMFTRGSQQTRKEIEIGILDLASYGSLCAECIARLLDGLGCL